MMKCEEVLKQLEKKVGELDKQHREQCSQMMKLDDEISVEMHRISSVRLKKSAISKSISHLQSTLHNLEKQKKQQLAHIEDSQKKLNEMAKSESIRRDLLSEIGVSPASNQFNVKRATLESHMKTQRGHLESLENQVANTQGQIDEQTLLLDPKNVEDLRKQVEAKIAEIKLHKVDLEGARFQVATQLSECQHLIDDVKMRITLENFALDNKLVVNGGDDRETLENMPIEDLVKLCEDSRPPSNISTTLTYPNKSSPSTPDKNHHHHSHDKHHTHSLASQNNHHHNHHHESVSEDDDGNSGVSDDVCSEGRHGALESEDEQECTDEECSCHRKNQSHLTKNRPNNQELIQHAHTEIYRLDGGYTRAATKELTCIKSGWMNSHYC
jgi:hypothetical protein